MTTTFVDVMGFISPQAAIPTNASPAIGTMQPYNATAGSLVVPLPSLASLDDNDIIGIKKDVADITPNSVLFTLASGDTLVSGSSQLRMTRPGEFAWLQVCTINNARFFEVIHRYKPPTKEFTFELEGNVSAQTGTERKWINEYCALYIVRASVVVPPQGQSIIADLACNGTSVYTNVLNRPEIIGGTNTDVGDPVSVTFQPGDYLTANIIRAGTTTVGSTFSLDVVLREIST